jgi:hypothetical protein
MELLSSLKSKRRSLPTATHLLHRLLLLQFEPMQSTNDTAMGYETTRYGNGAIDIMLPTRRFIAQRLEKYYFAADDMAVLVQ